MKEFIVNILAAFVICYVLFMMAGCATHPPKVNVTFWAGDSAKDGISRAQENRNIPCKEADFDDYACLTYEDVKAIFAAMLQCKEWGNPVMSDRDIQRFLIKNQDVIRNVQSK